MDSFVPINPLVTLSQNHGRHPAHFSRGHQPMTSFRTVWVVFETMSRAIDAADQ
jgi:hypothetical protein